MNKLKVISIATLSLLALSCSNEKQTTEEQKPVVATVSIDTANIILAHVCKDGKWGYINSDFKMVIQPQYDGALRFNEGLACVKSGDKWGFINIKGEFVIQPQFDEPGVFFDGIAKVGNMAGGGSGRILNIYIDKTGKNFFSREFKWGEDFNNGVAKVRDENNREIFINLKGETITNGPPLLYNHWKYPKKPYGGTIKNIVEWDPKKGMPKEVKHDRDNFGYTDEFGNAATEQIYCGAGEFYYSYSTPSKFFSTNKVDTADVNSIGNLSKQNFSITETTASYKKAEAIESEDGQRIILTFQSDEKIDLVFDGYNSENKLIELFFVCKDCTGEDRTAKVTVGKKYKLKFTKQVVEAEGGGTKDYLILEGVDVAK